MTGIAGRLEVRGEIVADSRPRFRIVKKQQIDVIGLQLAQAAFQDSTRGSDAVAPCLPAPLTPPGDATILPS